jgi:hypothetical protein
LYWSCFKVRIQRNYEILKNLFNFHNSLYLFQHAVLCLILLSIAKRDGTLRKFESILYQEHTSVTMESNQENECELFKLSSEILGIRKFTVKVNRKVITKKFHQPITHTKKIIEGQKSRNCNRVVKSRNCVLNFLLRYNNKQKGTWFR